MSMQSIDKELELISQITLSAGQPIDFLRSSIHFSLSYKIDNKLIDLHDRHLIIIIINAKSWKLTILFGDYHLSLAVCRDQCYKV